MRTHVAGIVAVAVSVLASASVNAGTYYLRADGTAPSKSAATGCGSPSTAMSISTHNSQGFSSRGHDRAVLRRRRISSGVGAAVVGDVERADHVSGQRVGSVEGFGFGDGVDGAFWEYLAGKRVNGALAGMGERYLWGSQGQRRFAGEQLRLGMVFRDPVPVLICGGSGQLEFAWRGGGTADRCRSDQ